MAKYKIGDKLKFIENYCSNWKKGDIVTVTGFWSDGIDFIDEQGREGNAFFKRFELFEHKRTKNQRIAALEKELTEIKLIVEGLRTPETVDVYERIEHSTSDTDEQTVKSPNELRAEVIERAKGFVEETQFEGVVNFTVGDRSVVAVYQDTSVTPNKLNPAISNCHPNDVFNEHIGKAIALGRALGLDVSEFEGAVQPTFAVGQTVVNNGKNRNPYKREPFVVSEINGGNIHSHAKGWTPSKYLTILNDTNAIYSNGGVE